MTFLQETAAQPAAGGNMSFLIMMLLIFVVMYFFMIRPQQKKQKEIAKFRNELKKGDKIVTIGGIYGTVDEIREKYVIIVVDGDVKLRVDKSAIVKNMSDIPAK